MKPISATISTPPSSAAGSLRHLAAVEWQVAFAAVVLAIIGLATIHSATAEMAGDLVLRQCIWLCLGLAAGLVALGIDYQLLAKFAMPIYGVAMLLLLLVLLVGQEAGGARSWLGVGSWRFQPSEFAKLATALMLARYLAGANRRFVGWREIGVSGAIVLVPMALVVLERDLGGAAMFLPLLAGALLVAGVRWQVLLASVLLCGALGAVAWNHLMLDYQRERVRTFLVPESDPLGAGYQLSQSKIAVGSGELTGRGYMQGSQSQLRFLPARHTDFIFAVLAEEWGFVGVAVVLGLYALFVTSAAGVAIRARDRTGILLVAALLSGFSFHVLYNTGMVVGLVPVTGIPLPFLSYGGSFTLTNFIVVGMILGVDFRRYVNR